MSNPAPITLDQLFRYYRYGVPHQAAAITELEADLMANGYATAMRRDRPWFATWSQGGKQQDLPLLTLPAQQAAVSLKVPYFSQLDNASGTGYRECFSSSCAMLAAYWGKLPGDDAYNLRRSVFGDTTDAQAQLMALRSLGLEANFRTDGSPELLEKELAAGRPVAVGWLHRGPVAAPSGGGHWSVVIGIQPGGRGAWRMNDPNGEADLINGGYTSNRNGAGLRYSFANWNPRWMVAGSGGWMLTCRKP